MTEPDTVEEDLFADLYVSPRFFIRALPADLLKQL